MVLKAFVSGIVVHPVIVMTPEPDRLHVSFSTSALFEDGHLVRHPEHEGIQYYLGNKEGGTEIDLAASPKQIVELLIKDAREWFNKEFNRTDGDQIKFTWLGDKMIDLDDVVESDDGLEDEEDDVAPVDEAEGNDPPVDEPSEG